MSNIHRCPKCDATGGLIYTRSLVKPVSCTICYFKKTGRQWNPFFDEEYLDFIRRQEIDFKQFMVEARERQARWNRERQERALLKEAMK